MYSQDTETGGLGLGPGVTSAIFLALIAVAVGYLSYSKLDAPSEEDEAAARNVENRKVSKMEEAGPGEQVEVGYDEE
jgi:hypothetical protein